jgi:hypothetical protein
VKERVEYIQQFALLADSGHRMKKEISSSYFQMVRVSKNLPYLSIWIRQQKALRLKNQTHLELKMGNLLKKNVNSSLHQNLFVTHDFS